MLTEYNFGEIDTGNLADVEGAFERARRSIENILGFTEKNKSLDRFGLEKLNVLRGYYEDFITRLGDLYDEYKQIQGATIPNQDYEAAKDAGEVMLKLVEQRIMGGSG